MTLNDAQALIRQSVFASRAKASAMEEKVRAFADDAADRSVQLGEDASQLAERMRAAMLSIAIAGILGGAILGWAISRFAISQPLLRAVDCLKRLAQGELHLTIFGTGRGDEIGMIADTVAIAVR